MCKQKDPKPQSIPLVWSPFVVDVSLLHCGFTCTCRVVCSLHGYHVCCLLLLCMTIKSAYCILMTSKSFTIHVTTWQKCVNRKHACIHGTIPNTNDVDYLEAGYPYVWHFLGAFKYFHYASLTDNLYHALHILDYCSCCSKWSVYMDKCLCTGRGEGIQCLHTLNEM